jgi:hypothetical protein
MTQPRHVLARAALVATALALGGGAGATAVVVLAGPASATAAPAGGADIAALPASQALGALQRGDAVSYAVLRGQVASLVAPRVGVDRVQLEAVWAATDPRRMLTVLAALTQLGVPYHRRAATPGQGFDCSGLTSWAWSQSGVGLPHQSGRQISGVARTSLDAVLPGDLLYWPGHVMLALGVGGAMVHAPHRGAVIELRMLSDHQRGRIRVGDPLA